MPAQGIPPNFGQALSDPHMVASLIAQQAALQQPSIAANIPQGAAANVTPSQPGYQAGALATGQLPPGMAGAPGYTQSDFQNLFTSSQNAFARPASQVICNLLALIKQVLSE